MLEVRALVKRFSRIAAVDRVSFTIHRGEVLGYLGPSEARQEYDGQMLTGLIEPSDGEIFFQGRTILADLTSFHR